MLDTARGFVIETRDDLALAADVLAEVKGKWKRLDEREKEITRPMNDALKKTRALFKPAKDYFGEVETHLKRAIGAHKMLEEKRNAEAARAAADAHEAGDTQGVVNAMATIAHISNVGGLTTMRKWRFEITDASKLPREFLCPNETLIKEHAAHTTGDDDPTPIPGVRFYPEVVVRSRAT